MSTTPPPLPYLPTAPEPKPPRVMPGGRPMGRLNNVSRPLKEAILLAAEEVGDEMADAAAQAGKSITGGLAGYLTMVARTDVRSFVGLLGKVLPMTIAGTGESGGIVVEIVRLATAKDANGSHPTA